MSFVSSELQERYNLARGNFNQELHYDIDSKAYVFHVPKSLSSAKPEAYTPQLVGLGPYHHFQPHLTEMQRVKSDVVKRLRKEFHDLTIDDLMDDLEKKFPDTNLYVRACYHKFLNMERRTLLWIMTVDALFLFYQLCQHGIDKKLLKDLPCLQGLADGTGMKLTDATVRRDIMMLENQIPIFFVVQMLTVACQIQQVDNPETFADWKTLIEKIFPLMLVEFCKAVSPLKNTRKCSADKALTSAHLLDLLYSMVMSRKEETKSVGRESDARKGEETEIAGSAGLPNVECDKGIAALQQTANMMGKMCSLLESLNSRHYNPIKRPATITKDLLHMNDKLLSTVNSSGDPEDPAEEKVLIQTASSLAKAGVKFRKTKYIEDMTFKHGIFRLPTLNLGINSEVVIRNLVAYEAMAISGPLEFARFVEMMDGLINTVDDVRLLKKEGIITDRLKDVEVMHLFNSMSKSIEVNSDSNCLVDKTIDKVNKFYKAAPSIKARIMLHRYVYGFWKLLTLVSTVLMILLTGLQAFCSAYNCTSLVRKLI